MINLGTLQFGLAIDTRALNAAQNRVQEFGRVVTATQQAANRGADTQIAAFRKQENALLSGLEKMKSATQAINKLNVAPQVKSDLITQVGRMYNDLTKQIGQAGKAVDSTKFDRSVASYRQGVNDLIRSAQTMSATSASASGAAEAAAIRQANAYARAEERVRNLNAAIERSSLNTNKKTDLVSGGDNALAGLRQAMSGGTMSTKQFSDAMNQFNAQLGNARRSFSDATAKTNTLTQSQETLRKTLQGVGSSFLLLNGHLGGMSTRIFALSHITSNLGIVAGASAGAITGLSLAASTLVKGAITTSIELEKASKALTAIHGNSLEAGIGMDYVRSVADQAGIAFSSTAVSYGRYVASAKAANQVMDETQRQFRIVAIAAGTLNLSAEDTQGVFRALEQILSKGKVQSEELRGQLGDRLPGAFAIAARAMKMTTSELSDMMKKGKVLSDDFVPKFVTALQQAYNIDLSKNIDSTQASINRLTTATTFMYEEFAKSTGVVQSFKALLEGLTSLANLVANNMNSIIQVMIGLTGAILGVVAAFTALAIINAVMGAMMAFGAALAGITTGMQLLGAAATALNAVLTASVLGAFLRVGLAIGAAYLGYKTLTDAVKANAAALGDTSQAEAFITAQMEMRTATDATTKALIQQQVVQLKAAQAAQDAALARVRASKTAYESNMSNTTIWGTQASMSPIERAMNEKRYGDPLRADTKELQATTSAVERQSRAVNGLVGILNKPLQAGGVGAMLDGSGGSKGHKETPNIDRILSVIDAYKAAQQQLDAMAKAKGPDDLLKFDDLQKARDQLRSLSATELSMAADAMSRAGLSTGNLTEDLARLNTAVRTTEEKIRAFTQVWNNIDRQMIELEGVDRVTSFLQQGGDPDKIFLVEALTAAKDALRKLDGQELEAIRLKLVALGFDGETAAIALAKLFAAQDKGKQLNDALADVANSVRDANDRIKEQIILQQVLRKGGANAGEWADSVLGNQASVNRMIRNLMLAGKTAEEAQAEVRGLFDALNRADAMEKATEKLRQRAEEWKQLWQDFKNNAVDSIWAVVEGTKSMGDAITDLFKGFAEQLTKNALNNVFQGALDSLGLGNAASDQQAQALATNTVSLDQLTMSIDQLVGALNASTMNAGGALSASGGSSIGGIGGSLLKQGLGFLGSLLKPRALGGPVTAGQGYRIAEQGTGGEIFFPGQSGTMIPLSKMASGNGGGGGYIDARTTIDARGATRDAIADLEQKMAVRDRKLRDMIPQMIDNRLIDNRMRGRAQS